MQPSPQRVRPFGFDEDEHTAMLALTRNLPRPRADNPIWVAAEFAGLVIIDRDSHPARLTLTRAGVAYDLDRQEA